MLTLWLKALAFNCLKRCRFQSCSFNPANLHPYNMEAVQNESLELLQKLKAGRGCKLDCSLKAPGFKP